MKDIKIKRNNDKGVKEVAYTVDATTNFPDAYDKLRAVFLSNDAKFEVDDLGAGYLLIMHDGLDSPETLLDTLKELSDCITCTEFENYLVINKLQILEDGTSVEDEYTLEDIIEQLESNTTQAPVCVCRVDNVSDDAVESTLMGSYSKDKLEVAVAYAISSNTVADSVYFVYDTEDKKLLFSSAGLEMFI